MANEIASAYLSLYTKMPGVQKDIEKSLGGAGQEFESSGAAGGTKFARAAAVSITAGAVVVAAAVAAITSKAVMSFAELEQNVGGSEAVFGQYADTVQSKGVEAYKNLGLSQSEYLATANKMGALFQGSGVEQVRALELTTASMQRAADMASVMGIEQSIAMDSVAGAAKGNFTMMDNLGVAMNATSIEAYAASQGMTDWSYATATSAEKAEVAMAMFMDSTSQYAGNFAKEATETVSGSFGLLSASWDSLLAGLGDGNADMSQLSANLVEAVKAVAANVAPVVAEIFSSLPEVFAGLFSGLDIGPIGELITSLSPMMLIFEALKPLLPEISALLMEIVGALVPLAQELAGALVPVISQLMAALLPIVAAVLPVLMQLFSSLVPIVVMLLEAFMPLLTPILALITPLLDLVMVILPPLVQLIGFLAAVIVTGLQLALSYLIPMITGVVDAISQFLIPIIDFLVGHFEALTTFLTGVFTGNWEMAWQGVQDIFSNMWQGIQDIGKGALNFIIDLINSAISGINGLAGGISDLTGGAINLEIGKIPRLADGAVVSKRPGGIIANIGEGRYDEAVIPLSPGVLSQIGGGGSGGGITQYNDFAHLPPEVAVDMAGQRLTSAARRARA